MNQQVYGLKLKDSHIKWKNVNSNHIEPIRQAIKDGGACYQNIQCHKCLFLIKNRTNKTYNCKSYRDNNGEGKSYKSPTRKENFERLLKYIRIRNIK